MVSKRGPFIVVNTMIRLGAVISIVVIGALLRAGGFGL